MDMNNEQATERKYRENKEKKKKKLVDTAQKFGAGRVERSHVH